MMIPTTNMNDCNDSDNEDELMRSETEIPRSHQELLNKKWNTMFGRLVAYKANHNSTQLPRGHKIDLALMGPYTADIL